MNPYSSATQIVAALRGRGTSALEMVELYLERRRRLGARVNAIVSTADDEVLAQARECDAATARRDRTLHGLPLTIKDGIHVQGWPSTGGIVEPAQARAAADAPNVRQLLDAGAIVIGKTNVSTANSDWQAVNALFGRSLNPWNAALTPGGSTGGGAAAVAAGLCAAELGSDIGGSIRIPAAFCGIYGHKPTATALPRGGHFPGGTVGNPARQLAVQGPLARSATDLELLFRVLCRAEGLEGKGWRPHLPAPRFERLDAARVGFLRIPDWLPVENSILEARDAVCGHLQRLGARVVEVDANPWFGDFRDYYQQYLIALQCLLAGSLSPATRAKAAAKMRGYDDGFLAAVADGLEAGAGVLVELLETFERHKLAWEQIFERVDVLLTPACSSNAFVHDDGYFYERSLSINGEAMPYYRLSALPALASVAGLPGTVFPTGRLAPNGSPIGLQ
ncbi:MAG TPA: amidase family protein, partial [Steroidobacteraceae bacterium]